MQIKLWYSIDMKKWRWSLTDEEDNSVQETGQRQLLHEAMNDVANTVEYVLQSKIPA